MKNETKEIVNRLLELDVILQKLHHDIEKERRLREKFNLRHLLMGFYKEKDGLMDELEALREVSCVC